MVCFSYSLLTRNNDAVQQLGPKTIKIVLGDLIIAGSDTTATGLSVNALPCNPPSTSDSDCNTGCNIPSSEEPLKA